MPTKPRTVIRPTRTPDRFLEAGPVVIERDLITRYSVISCPDCNQAITYHHGAVTDDEARELYAKHRTERIEWGGCKAKGRYA